jgi:hypothetical protein
MATESWTSATPYILADSAPILPMGGFSGDADFPRPQQFTAMVRSGQVRYVLLAGRAMHRKTPAVRSATRQIAATTGVRVVAGAGFGATTANATPADLTEIADTVTHTCELVPATAYGAVAQETAPLYRCG